MKHSGVRLFTPLLLGLFVCLLGSGGDARATAAPVTFKVGSTSGQPGTQVLVPVTVAGFTGINAFQFSLHWSAADASFVGVEQFGLLGLAGGNFGTTMTNNGTLTVSWDDPDGTSASVADGTIVFAVRLLLVGSLGSTSSLMINDTPTPVEAADGDLQIVSTSMAAGQLLIGQPNTAPVLAAIANKTINEGTLLTFRASGSDVDLPAQTLTYSLDPGAPVGASIDPVTGTFTWTPTEAQGPGNYSPTVRVTDSGTPPQSASQTISITVNEVNLAPVLAPIGNKTINEGALLSFTAVGSDPDIPAQALAYRLDPGAPAGATIDPVTGVFNWTPTEAQGPGSYTVTIRVTDNGSPALSAIQSITIAVNEVNTPPVLNPIGNKTVTEANLLTFTASATDADLPAQALTYSLDAGAPAGASINPVSGVFIWTPTSAQGPNTNRLTVRVTDNGSPALSASETITIVVNEINTTPVLAAIVNRTVNEGVLFTFTASATDADLPAQILTYTLDAGAPAGASINPATGVFSWTPAETQGPGNYSLTVRVTDSGNPPLSAARTFSVSVNEVNTPPVLASIGSKTVDENSLLTFTASATDSDVPAQTLTFSLDAGAPAGASINPVSGVFNWTPTEAQGPSSNVVTIRVTDNGVPSLNAFETITITVKEVNSPPALASIGNKTVNEGTLLTFTASATDADLPAQTLTYSLDAGAPTGASINPVTGVFTWTPTEAQGPSANPVTVRVTDNGSPSASASETIVITVNEVNSAPLLASIPNQTIGESSLLTFTASAIDPDLPVQTLTYSLDAGAPAGASIDPATGVFTWTPADVQGPSTNRVTIRVTDNGTPALSASQTITITVTEVNTAPVLAALGNKTVDEGNLLSFTVSATDANLPAQTLTYTLDAGAPTGASINPVTGLFTWTPTEAQGPSANLVTIRVTDSGFPPASATQSITITVNEVNTPPKLPVLGAKVGQVGTLLTCKVPATDADLPVQTLTYSLDPGAPAGASIDPATGLFSWTPTPDQAGTTNAITIRVTDNGSPPLSALTVLTISVTSDQVNTAPVLAPLGDQTINEGSLLTFTASATDADLPEQTLTYSLDTNAPAGAAIDPVTGVFTWTPTEAQGPSTNLVTILVTDSGSPPASTSQTITITVNEVNLAPVLAPIGNKTVNAGNLLTFTASATDTDLPAQTLTYSLDAGAPIGASINPLTGVFIWTPPAAQASSTNQITVRVTDNGSPALSAFETLTIIVNGASSAQLPGPLTNKIVKEGSLLTFTAAGALADISTPNLTYSLDAGAPAGAAIDPVTGVFTWTPTEAQGPSTNRVTFRVRGTNSATLNVSQTITITVEEVNVPPVLAPIGNKTVNEGSLLTFKVSGSDTNLPPQHLTYTLDAGAPAGASIQPNTGVFTWTPTEAQGPSAMPITIRVTDSGSPPLSASETIVVTVNEVNVAPVLAFIPGKTVNEGDLLTFKAAATDADLPAQTLTYSLGPGAPLEASIDPHTGVFTWTPTETEGGRAYTITIRVTDDGIPNLSASQTFTATVNEVNTPPVLAPIANQTTDEGTLLTFTASATDSDIPAQVLTYSLGAGAPAGASINPTNGVFSWKPTEAQGPSTNFVVVRVTDNGIPAASASQTVTITVNEVNTPPQLAPVGNKTVNEGVLLTFKAVGSDSDLPPQLLTYSLEGNVPTGATINPTNGTFNWTPSEIQGPASYPITIRVTDSGSPALSVAQAIMIIVNEVNSAPVLAPIGNRTVNELTPLVFTVLASDSDIPAQTLTYSLVAGPVGASIDPATGIFSWTPTEAQGPSTASVTVRVADSGSPALSASQTFTITVYEVNTPPTLAAIGSKTINEGSLLTFKASASDADVPAQILTYSLGTGAPAGASINPTTGVFTWTPTEAQGPSTSLITIRVTDNGSPALSASETIAVTVNEVNTAPVLALIANKTVNEGSLLTFKAAATDVDIPVQTLTYSLDASDAPEGASIDPVTGIFTWIPTEVQGPSTITLTIRVTDNGSPSLSAFQNVIVTVNEVNSAPVLARIPNQTIDEGALLTFVASATDADVPAQTLSYSLGAGAPIGASIQPATGLFTWTPTEAQGPSTNIVVIRVTDNGVPALGATQAVTITVKEVNTAPSLAPIGIKTVNEGSLLTFTAVGTDADLPAQLLTYSLGANSPAGASIDPRTGAFTWTPSEAQGPRSYEITVRVTDNGVPALSASQSTTIIVNEVNSAPVLAPIANKTVNEGNLLSFKVLGSDSDIPAQTLTYSLVAGPVGASIDPVSGQFSWTPTEAQGPSTASVTVRVTDSGSPALSAAQTFTITVSEVNTPPTLASIGNKTISEGSLLTFKASATDADVPAQILTYSLGAGAPAGASINPTTGVFTWTPTEAQGPSTNLITIRVTDNGSPALSASETIAIKVNEVNTAPVLALIANKTVNEGSLLTFKAVATDVDIPVQTLTYSLDASDAPEGASIDPVTGIFTWIPTEVQGPSTITLTIRVKDNGSPSLSAFQNVIVTVNEANSAPVLARIADQTVTEGAFLSLKAMAMDTDVPAQTLTYSLVAGAPAGASINPASGVFTWSVPSGRGASTNPVSVRVADNGLPSLSATQRFNILVLPANSPPPLVAVPQIAPDYLELRLGTTVVVAGQIGSVPITVTNVTGITNLSASLSMPIDRLTSPGITIMTPELDPATFESDGPGLLKMGFSASAGQVLQNGRLVGYLDFTAAPSESAFVPLVISDVIALQANGVPITRTRAVSGRVVVVGSEPLLEALPAANNQPSLMLYGLPGTNCRVESTSDEGSSKHWQTVWQGTLTNLSQPVQPAAASGSRLTLFRAVRQ